jgi:thiol-disulfide isomerase/thioredoxin
MSRLGFLPRLGLTLLAPRRAAELLCHGESGGFRDVLYLLPLRLLTGESALFLEGDPRSLFIGSLSALAIDLLVILFGGVIMALLIGRRERLLRAGLTTDLAAQGWFVWLFIQILGALACMITQRQPSASFLRTLQTLGALAWAAYFVIGLFVARREAVRAETSMSPAPSPFVATVEPTLRRGAFGVGGLFLGALLMLSLYDAAWLLRQRAQRPTSGRVAPEVVVPQIDPVTGKNSEFRLSAERGHPVLIDFWATWCGPCKQSLPILDGVYKRQAPRGLRAIAINMSDDEPTVLAFAKRLRLELPMGLDAGAASSRYGVSTIPHMVLVGKEGTVKRVFYGVHSAAEIEEALNSLGN